MIQPGPELCCIAVGMATAYPVWLETLLPVKQSHELNQEYVVAEKVYGYSQKVTSYLIALNDGMYVTKQAGFKGLLTFTHPDYVGPRHHIVRSTMERRDQAFIARFLEILWVLESKTTTSTANNVVST